MFCDICVISVLYLHIQQFGFKSSKVVTSSFSLLFNEFCVQFLSIIAICFKLLLLV